MKSSVRETESVRQTRAAYWDEMSASDGGARREGV
jgi:hypothetical protein